MTNFLFNPNFSDDVCHTKFGNRPIFSLLLTSDFTKYDIATIIKLKHEQEIIKVASDKNKHSFWG